MKVTSATSDKCSEMNNRAIVSFFDPKLQHKENVQNAFSYVCTNFRIKEEMKGRLNDKLYKLECKFIKKWREASRDKDKFAKANLVWLENKFDMDDLIYEEENVASCSSSSSKRGRPAKPFMELSDRSKRRNIDTEILNPNIDSVEKALLLARRTAFRRKDVNVVKVIGHLLKSQDHFSSIYNQLKDSHVMKTGEEALGFLIELSLSKFQYESIHFDMPSRYPTYDVIKDAKKLCAPSEDTIEQTGSRIKVQLQALMEHTATRIIKVIEDKVVEFLDANAMDSAELVLLSCWGMDGSTGYSQYNQPLPKDCVDDSDVFSSTLTPIQLFMLNDRSNIFWLNPMPQSIRYCRPLILQFIKESKAIILKTKSEIESEIRELAPININLPNEKNILVDFDFVLSMIDGKVLTYITGTSSMMNCPICGAKPNDMSNIDKFKEGFSSNEEALNYGISPLHAWLRFFECLLHISYRISFKKWKVTKLFKEQYESRKKIVKARLYETFGIRVDQPRSGGAGTSTTGNICRKAFSNAKLLSEALDIDEELIIRFHNILIAINCQQPINPDKFDEYCKATYELYLGLYSWYKIPATIHKVLAHAGEIIIHSPAPLGSLAEEAAESQHKLLKKVRTHHARKRSREANLHDVFLRALHESDPFLSSMWITKRRQKKVSTTYPDVVRSFMIFEDSKSCSSSDTLDDLMNDVDEVDENFADDNDLETDEE